MDFTRPQFRQRDGQLYDYSVDSDHGKLDFCLMEFYRCCAPILSASVRLQKSVHGDFNDHLYDDIDDNGGTTFHGTVRRYSS